MASDVVTIPEEQGVETHGIERVSPETRTHVRIIDNFSMWLYAKLVISTIGLGALAVPIFGLGFWDSVAVIIIFNALGVLPVAFFSTLGPKLGLRQMTISRFAFGWVGGIIMALFNVAACIGWSVVNVIIGGQLVSALSGGVIPSWAGILILAVLTTLVSIYGYRYVHRYERYAWIPMAIIFAIMFFVALPHFHIIPPSNTTTAAEIASLLSFGGAVYGFATGWSSYAADYNVNQPEETPASRVFWLTFLGVFIPCVLLETLGMAFTTYSPWSIILIEEHFVFRHGQYNVDDWNNPSRLPVGWAAIVSMAFGLVGVLLGAAQVYYVGPIAKLVNPPFGMDIGFELGVIFAGIAYLILRRIELNSSKRGELEASSR